MTKNDNLLTHDEKRSSKLSSFDIKQIRLNFPHNPNYKVFAETYNVSQNTIRYWVDDNYKKRQHDLVAEHYKRNKNDPNFIDKKNRQHRENRKQTRITYPKLLLHDKEYRQIPQQKQNRQNYNQNSLVKQREKIRKHKPEYMKKQREYANKRYNSGK